MQISPGGYVSLIESCAEAGDLSPLLPMSVKDLIWLSVAQRIKLQNTIKFEEKKREVQLKDMETFALQLADIKALLYDTDFHARIAALKDARGEKITSFPEDKLPSVAAEKRRDEEEMLAKMTPAQRQKWLFDHGRKIVL